MHRRSLAHLALFAVNAIYGINYVVAKGLMPEVIGASGFILLRVIGAALLFWLLRALRPERVDWSDAGRLFLCAVFGVALNQLMFFHGLMRTSPINASIIMVATPILVLVLSGVLIGERITRTKLLGVLLGASGALLLIGLKPKGGATGATMLGDAFILINAISYGLYLVLVKPLMRKYTAVTVMAWCLIGLVMVLPFGLGEFCGCDLVIAQRARDPGHGLRGGHGHLRGLPAEHLGAGRGEPERGGHLRVHAAGARGCDHLAVHALRGGSHRHSGFIRRLHRLATGLMRSADLHGRASGEPCRSGELAIHCRLCSYMSERKVRPPSLS